MRYNNKYIVAFLSLLLAITSVVAQDEKINGTISLQINSNDSMNVITATVINNATKQPVKDIEVTFYVQRTFGLMKVANGTSDTTGTITAEFPIAIQGSNVKGYYTLLAKVEENEKMNDTTFSSNIKSPLRFPPDKPIPPSIAGSHAPWWLAITFTLVVGIVWLLFVYVLYLVYRIKKASSKSKLLSNN
ncbi:MAG: hypothetical protein J0I09_02815 [Sphingobacteriia bacterium]|nr:hypothetical protein [Sphingobacteriia bacterium]